MTCEWTCFYETRAATPWPMRCMWTRMKCVQMCEKIRGVRVLCSQLLATSHPSQSRAWGSSWFEHPTEGYHSRDRSLWLFAAQVSSTMACLMLSRHNSLCILTSALICAVLHTSLESPPAGCVCSWVRVLRASWNDVVRSSWVFCSPLSFAESCSVFSSAGLYHGVVRWGLQHHRCGRCSR